MWWVEAYSVQDRPPQQRVSQPKMPREPRLDNVALDIPFVPIVIIPYLCDFLCLGGGEQAPGEQLNCMRGCKGRLNKISP